MANRPAAEGIKRRLIDAAYLGEIGARKDALLEEKDLHLGVAWDLMKVDGLELAATQAWAGSLQGVTHAQSA